MIGSTVIFGDFVETIRVEFDSVCRRGQRECLQERGRSQRPRSAEHVGIGPDRRSTSLRVPPSQRSARQVISFFLSFLFFSFLISLDPAADESIRWEWVWISLAFLVTVATEMMNRCG